MRHRLSALKDVLNSKGVPAFLVTDPLNIFYLSGFKAENACLLITTKKSGDFIITDFRFRQEAKEVSGLRTALIKTSTKDLVLEILKGEAIKRAGFEPENLSYSRALLFQKALKQAGITFAPLSGIVEGMRMVKDAGEIKKIKVAIRIAKKAFELFRKCLKPGKTEKGLCLELGRIITDLGGEEAFDTIAASGERSSRPHAVPTNRIIRHNEPLLLDFGVRFSSYSCDLTRPLFLGKIQRQLYNIYNICSQAQQRAIAAVKSGLRASEIDRVARSYIESKGFGKAFGHSLGHGIGLSVHELPRISSKTKTVLAPGMVITIEPGIYIEGVGGVRIEDMVLVTATGCEVLTNDIPK